MIDIVKELQNPFHFFSILCIKGFFPRMNDRLYLRLVYRGQFGRKLNLNAPKTFNEKMQWLKLNNHNPIYPSIVDKVSVKDFIKNSIGSQFLIPSIGVWDSFEEIDFSMLPNSFVLKCSHDSGGVIICKEKKSFDYKSAEETIKKAFKKNYYWVFREWPYKSIQPRILAEPYLTDESGVELKDYKLFTFNGKVEYIQVDYDRFTDHHRCFYDRNWVRMPFTTCYPTDPDKEIQKPKNLDTMIEVAEELARVCEIPPFLRVDLYNIQGRVLFGELTLYHGSGMERFYPEEWDFTLGKMIELNR